MIDRSTSGYTSGKSDSMLAEIAQINFGVRILVQPYDYGRSVPPKVENRFVERQAFESELVEGHVTACIRAIVYQISHCQPQNFLISGTIYSFISGNTG